ncbi:MAG: tyrosine-type recombinase/integrase [Dehalococcoidales bacterium]|jgi:integrase/recombinase XerD
MRNPQSKKQSKNKSDPIVKAESRQLASNSHSASHARLSDPVKNPPYKAYLEIADVNALEEAAANKRDRLIIRLLSRLGCRVSEVLGIAVQDIDFAAGTVSIQHLKKNLNLSCPDCGTRLSKSHVFCPGCSKKVDKVVAKELEHKHQRVLPLDERSLKLLREYIKRGGPVEKDGRRLLFGIKRGRVNQILEEIAKRIGLPKLINPETGKIHNVSPHKLRDYFAVNAVKHDDSGDGLRMLQEHLGHQNFNTTAKYRKVAGEELKHWYDGLWEEEDGHRPS